jgi:hypothetical protein
VMGVGAERRCLALLLKNCQPIAKGAPPNITPCFYYLF